MKKHKASRKFPPEHTSQWAGIISIEVKIGCTAQTLHTWVREAK